MAQTKIDGSRQIQALTITNAEISASAGIELSKLEEAVIQADGGQAFTGDQSMGGNKLTNLGTPTADADGATKGYVDSVAQGLDVKASVRVATTANITLSGTQTIDGVTLVAGDRVLVKDQTTGADNGIYVVASGAWTRATDADTSAKVTSGLFTFIEEGTDNGDEGWVLTTPDPITLGTTSLSFSKFSSQGVLSGGDGIDISANSVSVDLDTNSGLEFNSAKLRAKIKANGGVIRDVDGLSIEVDNSTVEVDATNGLQVKASGITATQIASAVAGSGLAGGGGTALSVNVDATTIEIATDTLQVKDGGIDENKIASSALGNGLTGGSGTTLSVSLATNSGLQFSTGDLEVKLKSGGGISKDVDGLYLSGSSETRVVREVPTGVMNGTNQDFTLANTPATGSEMVFYNGILLNEGATNDYTIAGAVITLADAPKANGKDVVLVTYWY